MRTFKGAAACLVSAVALTQTSSPPSVTWQTISKSQPREYSAKAVYPVFSGDSAVLQMANQEFKKTAAQTTGRFLDNAQQAILDLGRRPRVPFQLNMKTQLGVVNPNLVSGLFVVYQYTTGELGNTRNLAMNFGQVNNQAAQLSLKSLLAPNITPDQFAADMVLPEINRQKKLCHARPLAQLEPERIDQFAITPSGLTWTFAAGEIGAIPEGDYIVRIPWSRMRESLNPDGPLKPVLP